MARHLVVGTLTDPINDYCVSVTIHDVACTPVSTELQVLSRRRPQREPVPEETWAAPFEPGDHVWLFGLCRAGNWRLAGSQP